MAPDDPDHDHDHEAHPPWDISRQVEQLENLLVDKGLVDPDALDAIVATYEQDIGPRNGAKVVARAWTDPAYRQRLLADGVAAVAELGFSGRQNEHLVVVEN